MASVNSYPYTLLLANLDLVNFAVLAPSYAGQGGHAPILLCVGRPDAESDVDIDVAVEVTTIEAVDGFCATSKVDDELDVDVPEV